METMIHRQPRGGRLALFLLLVICGCGGDDSTGPGEGPTANPDFMVGDRLATSMLLTSKANPEVSVDLTTLGAVVQSFRSTLGTLYGHRGRVRPILERVRHSNGGRPDRDLYEEPPDA